ncbi:MAG: lytic murein transglycosylase [Bdellovibrionota bacterium]
MRNFSLYFFLSIACMIINVRQLAASTKDFVSFSQEEQNLLNERFSEIGVPIEYLKEIFSDPRLHKYPDILPKNIYNKEIVANYSSFKKPYSLYLTRKFLKKWRTRFLRAEAKYGVDKEAIASIILVETGLGSIKGRYHVMSVFASIVVEGLKSLEEGDLENEARYEKKVDWATNELKSLLIAGSEKKLNVLTLKGSRSGAFGICQFLPSSFQKWAIDGDKDNRINLHTPQDAIPSVANYLKNHGWKRGLKHKDNRGAVFNYNNSNIYVDVILHVAEKLKK